MIYVVFFIASFILALIITQLIRYFAVRLDILDQPEIGGRKVHKKPVPLLGGMALFITFFVILFIVYLTPLWPEGAVKLKHLLGLFIGGLFLMIGGFLDDKYHLKPYYQIIWPIMAAIVIGISGIGIEYINNPFGPGYLHLDIYKIEVIQLNGIPYYFTPLADILTFVWLILLMYATKLLDGLDGLVGGLTFFGALSIAGLCFLTIFYQPDVGSMALILAGAALGFLLFNFHPAKIFLGEGGSLFAGFTLGALAIVSGGKLATTFLILGLAVFDLFGVVIRRLFIEHSSPFLGDRGHLHFRLLQAGLSHKKAVLLYWIIALLFGIFALFLQTTGKIIALIILLALSTGLIGFLPARPAGGPAKKSQIDKQGTP